MKKPGSGFFRVSAPGLLCARQSTEVSPNKAAEFNIADLQRMSMKELLDIAEDENLSEYHGLKKQDLIFSTMETTAVNASYHILLVYRKANPKGSSMEPII